MWPSRRQSVFWTFGGVAAAAWLTCGLGGCAPPGPPALPTPAVTLDTSLPPAADPYDPLGRGRVAVPPAPFNWQSRVGSGGVLAVPPAMPPTPPPPPPIESGAGPGGGEPGGAEVPAEAPEVSVPERPAGPRAAAVTAGAEREHAAAPAVRRMPAPEPRYVPNTPERYQPQTLGPAQTF